MPDDRILAHTPRPEERGPVRRHPQGHTWRAQEFDQLLAVAQTVLQCQSQALCWQASRQLAGSALCLPGLDQY